MTARPSSKRKGKSASTDLTLTTQTRLHDLSTAETGVLDALGAYHGRMKHQCYAYLAAHGGQLIDHKRALCAKLGLSSRFFNALRVELQASVDSVRELLQAQLELNLDTIIKVGKKLERLEFKLAEVKADRLRVDKTCFEKWQTQRAKALRRLERLRQQQEPLQSRLAARVPGIAFGSRKLFRKQFFLQENGYRDHAEWLADWRAARSHQAYFLGSKDESGGNQQCTLVAKANGLFELRVRIPDALLAPGQDKYLWLRGLRFEFQDKALRAALVNGQALSWRLHRDERGWRAMVSFARPAAPLRTGPLSGGVVSADFNVDHLAVTVLDRHGNKLNAFRIELALDGLSTGQRKARLSDALTRLVNLAEALGLPLVVEQLDFQKKKQQLAKLSPAQARVLSSLAYAQYQQLLDSKCARQGVQLIRVDPAYTSVIGRVKYALKQGISVHQAAAQVIGRRAKGYVERPPRVPELQVPALGTTLTFVLPVRKGTKTQRVSWGSLGVALGKQLRKHWLSTRGPGRGVRKAGTAVRLGSHGSGPPSGDDRTLRAKPSTSEQVCTY